MSNPPDLFSLGLAVPLRPAVSSRLRSSPCTTSPPHTTAGFEFNATTKAKLGPAAIVEWLLLGAKMPRKQTPPDEQAMLSSTSPRPARTQPAKAVRLVYLSV